MYICIYMYICICCFTMVEKNKKGGFIKWNEIIPERVFCWVFSQCKILKSS